MGSWQHCIERTPYKAHRVHAHTLKKKTRPNKTLHPHTACLSSFREESECLQPPSQCLQASCCVHVSSACQYGEVVFMILKCEILAVWDKLDWSGFSVALSEETRQAWLVQLTTLFDNDYLYFKYRWACGNRRAHNTNRLCHSARHYGNAQIILII